MRPLSPCHTCQPLCSYVVLAKTVSKLMLLGSREKYFFISQRPFNYPDIIRGTDIETKERKKKLYTKWQETDICLALAPKNVWWCPIAQENAIQVSNIKNHSCGLWRDKCPISPLKVPMSPSLPCYVIGAQRPSECQETLARPPNLRSQRKQGKNQLWSWPQVI